MLLLLLLLLLLNQVPGRCGGVGRRRRSWRRGRGGNGGGGCGSRGRHSLAAVHHARAGVHGGHDGGVGGHRPVGRVGGEEALLVGAAGGRDRRRGNEAGQLGIGGVVVAVGWPENAAKIRDTLVGAGQGRIQALADLHQGMEVELVGIALPVHLLHDVLVVVVAEGPAHLVVVHVGLGLPLTPPPCHLIRIRELELPGGALPRDDGGVGRVGEQLQQELPQLDLAGALGHKTP